MRNTLNDQLARVRESAGLEPLPDPGVIQGFGPGAPPAPPYLPPPHDPDVPPDWLDPELDMPTDPPGASVPRGTPPSPLIPRKAPARPTPRLTPEDEAVLGAMLLVVGTLASWKGREVTLTDSEEKQVRAIVLRAIQNEVQNDLNEAGAPRKRRRSKDAPKAPEPAGEAPKKRGRPRKVTP